MTKLVYRDKEHAYWYDGRRAKGVTTVAKIPDDTYNLNKWAKRQVALGVAIEPSLREHILAHHDDRDALDAFVEQAETFAKTHLASADGVAVHRILERIDTEAPLIDTPLSKALRTAWAEALDKAGLEVLPEYVERCVVHPGNPLICGRLDRIVRRRLDGMLVVLDVKNGGKVKQYPHAIAVQLALYANAPLLAGPLKRARNGAEETDEFDPMPDDVDREHAYVAHTAEVANGGPIELLAIDIAAGWDTARTVVFGALAWRTRKDLLVPVASVTVPSIPATDKEFTQWAHPETPSPAASTSPNPTPPTSSGTEMSDSDTKTDTPMDTATATAPPSSPSSKPPQTSRSDDDAMTLRETQQNMPRLTRDTRPCDVIDDGHPLTDNEVAYVRKKYDALGDDEKKWVNMRVIEARNAGTQLSMAESAGARFERRAVIAVAMCEAVLNVDPGWNLDENDLVRHVLDVVRHGEPRSTIGASFAALTIDQGRHAIRIFRAVGTPELTVGINEDGSYNLSGPALAD